MLVEMDGFETNLGVIVIAATNRPDILDPPCCARAALTARVYVTLPDIRGREQILNVHMRKVPWAGRERRHHRARHARHERRRPGQPVNEAA